MDASVYQVLMTSPIVLRLRAMFALMSLMKIFLPNVSMLLTIESLNMMLISTTVLSGGYNTISNDSIVNTCVISEIKLKYNSFKSAVLEMERQSTLKECSGQISRSCRPLRVRCPSHFSSIARD